MHPELKNTAILFLNGKVDVSFCESYISENFPMQSVYCADGAYNKVKASEFISPKIKRVIGDFDSYKAEDNDLFLVDHDQYSTDFEKSLEYLLKLRFSKVVVFGASEGEMDHFLANMSIAKLYAQKIVIEFVDGYSRYFFIPKKFMIKDVEGKMFSIMPFGCVKNIYYNGLKYPLNGEDLEFGVATGIRNYAIENDVSISYSNGKILLFISHKKYKDRLNAVL